MSAALPPPPPLAIDAIALFLDVDGTLLEIAPEPDAVVVSDVLRERLKRLNDAGGGALALISGRSLEQLDRLFAPLRFSAAGLHGLERRTPRGGTVRTEPDPAALDRARARLAAFAAERPGVRVEDKGPTLALHYRGAPAQRDACEAAAQAAADESDGALVVLNGKRVFELKPPEATKGRVVETLMQEPPFAGRRPVFVGDDVTDEDGFEAVGAMNGIAIRVGADERATAARCGLADVDAVHAWLGDLLAGAGRRGRSVA